MKNAVLLFSSIAVFLLSACSQERNKNNKTETFPVTNPVVLDTTFTQDYVADIHAVQNVEIRARIKGFIDKVHVDEGKMVEAGQLLFTISSQELKQELLKADAQLKSAVAEAKMAEVGLSNAKILLEKNIVSEPEMEMAKAKLEAAQAKVEEMQSAISSIQLSISFASIKAPFTGMINRLPLKAGSLVDEGTLLTHISNDKEVFAYFNLSEKQYLSLVKDKANNQQKIVRLITADGDVFPHAGKIETAESEFDRNTGNLAFRARFNNPEKLLKHGSSGKIQIVSKLKQAMLIPQKATFEVQENNYVYVLDKDNVVQSRSIVIGHRLPHLYVVSSGLSVDDKVIYEGIQRVKEGDKINSELRSMKNIIGQLSISNP
jgi:RND family efflux transporter MFP subunit